MKTKKPILRLAVLAALSFFTGNEIVAQTNVGAACGCPSVGSRTAMNVQTYAASLNKWSALPASAYGGEITGNITLTCDKVWTIDQKIYVASGVTLTIEPGTVIKSSVATSVAAATALIIERGGKIMAPGTVDCPIVFTASADDLSGSYGIMNKGKWGGVLLCGTASNNLTLTPNGPFTPGTSGFLAVADGLGVLEGFASSLPQDQFGAVSTAPTGYTLCTSPSGTFTKTATAATPGTATSTQNVSGVTSLIVTAAPTTALNGQTITGTGIASNTTVSGSTTSLTLSNASTAALSGSYVVSTTATGVTTGNTASELALTSANALILPGMAVSGAGIAANTTVVSNSGTTVTLSAAAGILSGTHTFSFTYTAANSLNNAGQNKLNLTSLPSYVVAGCTVTQSSGTEIPANTTILSISGNVLTLSNNLTGTTVSTAPNAIQIAVPYQSPGLNAYFPNSTATVGAPVLYQDGTTTAPTTSPQLVNFQSQPILSSSIGGFNDNDNSGVMTYVSIRHSGANLLVGSEINGLTLASVGRGTKIEHVEIVSCADDNIEIFGGTVNLKYCTTMFGNDDMFDYDLGWTGKAQFLFGMKANEFTTLGNPSTGVSSGISNDSDNGFEMDSDDGKSYNFKSTPTIYNATLIGNEKTTGNSDNSGLAAVMAKENTGGEIRNSIFANFRNGFNMVQTLGTGRSLSQGGDSWHNWSNSPSTPTIPTATAGNGTQTLKVKCNTFVGNTNALSVDAGKTTAGVVILSTGNVTSGIVTAASQDATYTQFVTTDKNIIINTANGLAGFDPSFLMNSTATSNTLTTKNDVVPNVHANVSLDPAAGCPQAPMDGFFEPANYRGAFKPGTSNDNWLSDWSYTQVLGSTKGTVACPTDINNDGVTDVNDFLMFSQKFNQSCN